MKHPRLIIGILAAVHLLLTVVVIPRLNVRVGLPPSLRDALLMLAPSQGCLCGLWIALGGKRTPWRVLFAIVGFVAFWWCGVGLASNTWTPLADAWVVWFGWQTGVVGSFLLTARLTGLRLINEDALTRPARLQFSIAEQLTWIMAFAVLFGAIRCLPPDRSDGRIHFENLVFAITGFIRCGGRPDPAWIYYSWLVVTTGIFTGVSLAAIWLALGRTRLPTRILLMATTIAAGSTSIISPAWLFILLLAIQSAWIVGSLVVVRLAGYRLSWQWRFGRGGEGEEPPITASAQP